MKSCRGPSPFRWTMFVVQRGGVEEGEVVIGTLTDDLKRLYAVLNMAGTQKGEFRARISRIANLLQMNEAQADVAEREWAVLQNRYELAQTCFWNSVRHAFPGIGDARSIALRKDWQLVTCPKNDSSLHGIVIPIPESLLGG